MIGRRVLASLAAPAVALMLIFPGGCSRPPQPVYDLPAVPSGYWETAWVEPRIIMADSVFTLIRADRVDSIYVDWNRQEPPNESPAIEFAVPTDSCFVAVNLALANHRGIAYPLIARFFPRGNYKLSLNLPLKLEEFPPRGALEFRANICGTMTVMPVIR